jgi:hypothetical protein
MLNVANAPFGRIKGLFRCRLPSKKEYDVLFVHAFRVSTSASARPLTAWENCVVVEPTKAMFVSPQYVTRGAVLVDKDLDKLPGCHYIVCDTIDPDMFLRMGN